MTFEVKRKTFSLWLAVFLLAGTALAQPLQGYMEPLNPKPNESAAVVQVAPFNGEPVEVLHSGRGYVSIGNESHTLRLSVESLRPIEPKHMRNLLTSNKSLDEIRAALDEAEGEARYDGTIKLDEIIYSLINIKIFKSSSVSSELYADIIEPAFGATVSNAMTIVGHIKLTIAYSETDYVGRGELIVKSGPQAASYHVFLNMQPPLQNRSSQLE